MAGLPDLDLPAWAPTLKQTALIVAVIMLIGLGAASALFDVGTAVKTLDEDTAVFKIPPPAHVYPAVWAINNGKVEVPDDIAIIRPNSQLQSLAMTLRGSVDVGLTPLLKMGAITKQNPNIKILRDAQYSGEHAYGLYAPKGSEIDSLQDLAGKRVAAEMKSSRGQLFQIILDREGIEDEVTIVDSSSPKTLLKNGDVDAAVIFGSHPDLKHIMWPTIYWEEANNGSRYSSVLFMARNSEYVDEARKAADVYRKALRVGYNNLDKVAKAYYEETGQNLTGYWKTFNGEGFDGLKMIRLTKRDVRTMQTTLDEAAERGFIKRSVNLTDYMPNPP